MRNLMLGTALTFIIAATPALANEPATSAGSETIPSLNRDEAVSQPADKANGDGSTMIEEGTEATTAGSNAIVGADEEPVGTFDRKSDATDNETTLEEGKRATTAGAEVVPAPDQEPVSAPEG